MDKKKILKISIIGIVILLVIVGIIYFIPVKTERIWVNDDEIAEIGHDEIVTFNAFNLSIKSEKCRDGFASFKSN